MPCFCCDTQITDFGLSYWKTYVATYSTTTIIGTPAHIAPEIWETPKMKINEKSDVYSYAILLWELYSGKKAFKGISTGKCTF